MAEGQKQSQDIIKWLEDLFAKAPHLPENIREVLVKIAPIISLVFGILGILAGLAAAGLSPLAVLGGIRSGGFVLITGLLTVVSSVLLLMAYPKLKKRAYGGWVFLFWSNVVSIVSSLLSITIGSVIGIIIGLYLLFEIKKYYK